MKTLMIFALLLVGCHTGNWNESCNVDGTCNNDKLVCDEWQKKCLTEKTHREGDYDNVRSKVFCSTCSTSCSDAGVKQCIWSDVSVWGAKPAVCECK